MNENSFCHGHCEYYNEIAQRYPGSTFTEHTPEVSSRYFLCFYDNPNRILAAMRAGIIPIALDTAGNRNTIGQAGILFRSKEELFYILDIITGRMSEVCRQRAEGHREKTIATLILVHDRFPTFKKCMDRFIEMSQSDIYVLDNASEDPQIAKYLSSLAKTGKIKGHYRTAINLYCAPGRAHLINQVPLEKYDYILFLDDDLHIETHPDDAIRSSFQDEAIGGVTGIMLNHHGMIESDADNYNTFNGVYRRKPKNPGKAPQASATACFCNFLIGGFSAVRAELIPAVCSGMHFYTAGKADYDWSLRMNRLGSRILFNPQIRGTHLKDWNCQVSERTQNGCEATGWRTSPHLLESAMRFRTLWGGWESNDNTRYASQYDAFLRDKFGVSWEEIRRLGI